MADVTKINDYNIKDSVARTRHEYPLSSGASNFASLEVAEKNGVVVLSGDISAIATANTWVELGTLPTAIKPSYMVAGNITSAFGNVGIIRVTTAGKIEAWVIATFSAGYYYFNLAWINA